MSEETVITSDETVEKRADLLIRTHKPEVWNVLADLLIRTHKPEVWNVLTDVVMQLSQLPEEDVRWRLVIMPGKKKEVLHCEQCKQDFEVFVERENDPESCPLCGSEAWYIPF